MKLLFYLFVLTFSAVSWAQNTIDTEIKAENVFELSIVDIFPESYPEVSVIFQAKNNAGKPLWMLKKSEMSITENGDDCEIIRLINITENKPINIGLVFDHSGSMFDNPTIGSDSADRANDAYFSGLPVPSWYTPSIDYGKQGILEFMESMEDSDSALFVGFNDKVDKVTPLSSNLNGIKTFLKSVSPSSATAFYDALDLALDSLSAHGSSSAIVALTDGYDNSSIHTYSEVIEKATKLGIPIYIIGLGDVDPEILKSMCSATNGFFYQTNNPKKLGEIYASIKQQLKSIYQVDYRSMSDDFSSEDRTIKFSFLNDTLTFSNPSVKFSLPDEAKDYLEEKENARLAKIEAKKQDAVNQKLLFGGIGGGILLLGIGSFLVYRRRKTKLEIVNVFPNPFSDSITIEYNISEKTVNPELKIVDLKGTQVGSHSLSSSEHEITINTSEYGRGVYIFGIHSGGKLSNRFKAVKK